MERRSVDDYWLLRRMMNKIVEDHVGTIQAGRYIMKHTLYTYLRYWRRFSKHESRRLVQQAASACPGLRFTNRGLFVPLEQIDPVARTFKWPRRS